MGLALAEPSKDDAPETHAGVPFLLSEDVQWWVDKGRVIRVEFDETFQTLRVYLAGAPAC